MTSCLATPANSTVTGTSNNWVCNTGYIRSGQSCVPGSCPTGNYQVKDTCVPLPLNSTVTSDGLYFQCNTGYALSNGSCIQISASGGTINNIGNYIIHQFTSSGNFTPTSSGLVTDILIVGQGGSNVGSGGQVTYIPGYALQPQTYVIQVTGTQSSFGSFVATKGADRQGVGAGGPSGVWGRGPGLQYDTSGYSLLYGVAGGNSGLTGEPQTGNGGDTNLAGGSGAVYVRYLKTNCITGNVWDASTQTCVKTCPATFPFTRNNFCTTCTTGYLSGGACVMNCPASTYGSKGTCVQCPGIQTSTVGSTSITQCICPANSYGDAGNGVCTSCPQNTISPKGSTSSSACTLSCPANSYASGTNCVNCPSPTTSSPSGSLNLNDCVCPSNGFLYQNTCLTQCPANTYISGKTCMVCPGVQISSVGSTICACPTTSYGTAGSGNCTQCTGNKVANATNNGCVCPASSPQWDPIAQWCVSQCPLNTYALNGTCTNCPQNLQSPVGSTSSSNCSCSTILAPFYNQTSCVGLTNPGTISPSSGGTITYNNQTVIHTFTSSGTFMPPSNITNATVYVVGGGAGGSSTNGGGGVGGEVRTYTNASFSSGASYPVTVGAGGYSDSPGTASSISTYTANGGSGSNQGGGLAYNITLNRIPLTNRTSPCVCTTGIANYVPQNTDDCNGIDSCQNNFYYREWVPTRLNCVYNTSYVALNKTTRYSYNCTTDPYKYYIDDVYRPSQVARTVQSLNPATWTPLTSALSRGVPSPGTTTPYGTFGAWGGTINYGAITGAGKGLTVNSSNFDNATIVIPFTDVSDATNAPANTGGGGGAGWVATYSSTSIINKPGGAGGSGIVIVTYPMSDECPTDLPFYDYSIGKCTTCLLYNYATPVFDASTGLCSSCSGSLIWNEKTKQCVASCSGELSFTNPTKRTCVRNTPQSCPVSAPYWNDFDCASSLTQISIYGGATGGDAIVNNGTYIVHTFTKNGNFIPIASGIVADILIVGGGGGGAAGSGGQSAYVYGVYGGQSAYVYGGGGGGQVRYIPNVSLNVGTTYAVTVGKGGASGQNGGDSQFGGSSYTSIGGQAGGGGAYNGSGNGGGGNASYVYGPPSQNWGTVSTTTGGTGQNYGGNGNGQINVVNGQNSIVFGGPAVSVSLSGGGGGGSNGAGTGNTNTGIGGNGGNGIPYDMSGVASASPVYYGSGGGGGGVTVDMYISLQPDGTIASYSALSGGGSGLSGRGGGGGDGGSATNPGTNGIVIVRYRVQYACPGSIYHYNPSVNLCTLCDATTPYYNTSYGTCTACPAATPYFNGLTCVASCPPQIPNPDQNNICTLPCVNQFPFWEPTSKMCVSRCPSTNPVATGTTCGPCAAGTSWSNENQSCGTCPESVVNRVCTLCRDINIQTPVWNGTTCAACPSGQYWNGSTCLSCSYPTPVYKSSTNSCVSCAQYDATKPFWNTTARVCQSCPTSTPSWNGSACVTCAQANINQPYWNGTQCAACPSARPIWSGTTCVGSQPIPLGPMTSPTTTTANGNVYISSSTSGAGWRAFDGDSTTYWQVGTTSYSPGVTYTGKWGKTDDTGVRYPGEYVQIQLPFLYRIFSYTISSTVIPPTAWTLLASSDQISWHVVDSRTGVTNLNQTFLITTPDFFSAFAFVIQQSSGNQPSISEITMNSVGAAQTAQEVLSLNQINILNGVLFSGCTTDECAAQAASTADITNLVYGSYPPISVSPTALPQKIQGDLSNCNSNVDCNFVSYDFRTDNDALLPSVPYIIDTTFTTSADAGVFGKKTNQYPTILQAPAGFLYNIQGTLQGTQLTGPSSPATLTACSSACNANSQCKGFNYNQANSVCLLFSTLTSISNLTDPNFSISFLKDPYILTSTGNPTTSSGTCDNVVACNADISNLLNKGVTSFSVAELNSCTHCPVRAVTKQGSTYYVTNESNVVTTSTTVSDVLSKMQFSQFTNAVPTLGTRTKTTFDWPSFIGSLAVNSQGYYYSGGVSTKPYEYIPYNFQDRVQMRISPYGSQGTVSEIITLWDMNSTRGSDALAAPWLQLQYSNVIHSYVLVSNATGKTYSAGNPGMYGPTIQTTNQPNGRNPNYSIFHIIAVPGGYKFKSVGTYNNNTLYQPYLEWSAGQTLPVQGTGTWVAGSGPPPAVNSSVFVLAPV